MTSHVARGAVLVPWPNRVGGGADVFDGVEHQLALTEPDRGNVAVTGPTPDAP